MKPPFPRRLAASLCIGSLLGVLASAGLGFAEGPAAAPAGAPAASAAPVPGFVTGAAPPATPGPAAPAIAPAPSPGLPAAPPLGAAAAEAAPGAAPSGTPTAQPSTASGERSPPLAASGGDASRLERMLGAEGEGTSAARPQPFVSGSLRQFGYDFFRIGSTGFAPVLDVPVSADYLVGPGDHLVVNVWGSIEGAYDLEVSRSGEVTLPKVGSLRVWGVPFGRLPDLIHAHLARVFKDFQLNVNMGKLRLIRVFVVGEVTAPGGYDLSSLSTVVNALSAAGGPTKSGTLRNVQLRREGKVVGTVDLYDFFLKGDKSSDTRLQAGDTVFVPVIGKVAGVGGNVRRPAIYELKGPETLKDLLALAGGIIPTGYLQRVQIARIDAHEKKVVADLNLEPSATSRSVEDLTAPVALQDLDMVKVFPIDQSLRGYVRLDGYVLRPGDYALKPGMRVSDLLLPDNLLPEYYAPSAALTRLVEPDFHPETLYFDVALALAGDARHNLALQEFDTVRVFSRWEMEPMPEVAVSGEVQRPARYRLLEGMRVRDLVLQAGNLKLNAYRKSAELVRVKRTGTSREAHRLTIDLEEALRGDPAQNLLLQVDDELVVRSAPLVPDPVYPVTVSGQVLKPGSYRLYDKMAVADLVREAGGPTPFKAYLANAEINRIVVREGRVQGTVVNVNLGEALKGNSEHNLPLAPYDELVVRPIPDWLEETDRSVTLRGEFRFPGVYPIYKGERLSSVIQRAGGFTDRAYLRAAKFTRRAVQVEQQRRMDEVLKRTEEEITQKQAELASTASSKEELEATKTSLDALTRSLLRLKQARAEGRVVIHLDELAALKGGASDVELQAGDALDVPQSSDAVSVLGEVYSPTTLLAQADRDVDFYLGRAGGPTKQAEEGEIYVIRADGSLVSRQQRSFNGDRSSWFSGWFAGNDAFLTQRLEAGDTVVVPRRIEKIAWMREIKDITQILANVALSAGVLIAAGL